MVRRARQEGQSRRNVHQAARAIERDETAGLVTLIMKAINDPILGAEIFSSDGSETVHVLHMLMLANLPYATLKGAM